MSLDGQTNYFFETCMVSVYDPQWEKEKRQVLTVFRQDESMSTAIPQWGDPNHIAASWFCGYGGDQWRMMVEHELAHAFLADWYGHPYSYSVWADAHGKANGSLEDAPEYIKREEHLVTSFQRFVNTGYLDDYDLLRQSMGGQTRQASRELQKAAHLFLNIARPWLYGVPDASNDSG